MRTLFTLAFAFWASIASAQLLTEPIGPGSAVEIGPGTNTGSGGYPACTQSTAAIALLTTPSAALQSKLNNGICNVLVAAGTWAKLDAVYILAADTAVNARKNLISSSFPLTVNGTCTFAAGYGYQCDGSTGYLATGMVPSTAGGHYTQNSASFGVTVINNRTTLDLYAAMGAVTASSIDDYIAPFFGGLSYGIVSGGAPANASDTTSQGNYVVTRNASNAVILYKNGTSFATASSASVGLANNQFIIGARYLSYAATVTNWSADSFSFAFIGGGLTQADVTALNTFANIFTKQYDYPLEVMADGFHTTTLSDNFSSLSTIDTTNSGAPGFNWYLRTNWPNRTSLTSAGAIALDTPGRGITLTNAQDQGIHTAIYDGAGGYIGKVFGGGGYFEVSAAFNPALGGTNENFAFWSLGIAHLMVTPQCPTEYIETDFAESFPAGGTGVTSYQVFGHDWTLTGSPGSCASTGNSNSNGAPTVPPSGLAAPTWTQFHRLATVWHVNSIAGTGTIHRYFDNALLNASFTYSHTAGSSPAFTPSNPSGVFSLIDSDPFFLILSTGGASSGAQNINQVTVIQAPLRRRRVPANDNTPIRRRRRKGGAGSSIKPTALRRGQRVIGLMDIPLAA